jgi:hypothetical protein
MQISMERALRITATLACATVLGMIGIFFATGVGQDPLQFVHPSDEYQRLLLHNPAALRACLALDDAFIVFYTTVFVTLGAVLRARGAHRDILRLAIGLLFSLAVLDLFENMHFLVMLARAQQGHVPSDTEIALQVWESLIKFHVSYAGLFLLAFSLPRRTLPERVLAYLSFFVQLPVGILIYVTPKSIAVPLVFVRFGYFLAGFALLALTAGKPSQHTLTDSSPSVEAD